MIQKKEKILSSKNLVVNYSKTNDIFKDSCNIIDAAQEYAYHSINIALIERNWLLGYRIAEEELDGKNRADYGATIIRKLSENLTNKYGKGFDSSNLYKFWKFYKLFPNILDSVSLKSKMLLSWTHYRVLLQVNDNKARKWYEAEAINETWSVRTLQRNIESQYYYRLLKSSKKNFVKKSECFEDRKLEFIKNPVIAEFLGISNSMDFYENDLEKCIINNLQEFLIELGKGYAFVARQYHIKTEKENYFIDLVFYNYILKCFVLIDLKTTKITHQDVGQMDMYIKMFDEMKKRSDDNPTIGILLCSDTDEDIARYSILHDNNQLFASKYMLYMPTKEELNKVIETQKETLYLKNNK